MKIDNIRIKYKLILMYVFSVLLPLIATNGIVYFLMTQNSLNEQQHQLDFMTDRIMTTFNERLTDCIDIANTITTDTLLNNSLDEDYESYFDYFDNYIKYLRRYLNYYDVVPQLENIAVYTNNQKIVSGGYFLRIDGEVEKKDWYKAATRKVRGDLFFIHTDLHYTGKVRKKMSFMRYDSYNYGSRNIKKLIRLDLSYEYFNNYLKKEFPGPVYIVDDRDRILFTNDRRYNLEGAFPQSKDIVLDGRYLVRTRSVSVQDNFGQWKIIAAAPKINLLDMGKSYTGLVVLLVIVNLLFPSVVIGLISKSLNTRLKIFKRHVDHIETETLEEVPLKPSRDEVGVLIGAFNAMTSRIKMLIHDVYEEKLQKHKMELEKKQAEINALQSQINPHFLFNTLETIRMRSVIKEERETANIIKALSRTFRKSLTWENDLITLAEEISTVRDLLEIEKYRFADKLEYTLDIDPSVGHCQVPKMCIVTFVENACVHGIENIEGDGRIAITIERCDKDLLCTVMDNGNGMGDEKIRELEAYLKEGSFARSRGSIGIKNVYRRFCLIYDQDFDFSITRGDNGKGTKVVFRLPILDKRGESDA